MPPEAPQIGLGQLLLGGRGNRHDAVLARVQGRRHTADGTALAGRIVALEYRHQGMLAQALVAHQAGQARLLGCQLLLVLVFVQTLGHVQAVQQAEVVQAGNQRRRVGLAVRALLVLQRGLQALQQNAPDGEAAVILVGALDHIPGRVVAAAAAQDALTVAHKLVVGFRLLPVQRADPPAVQRVVLEGVEARVHLLFRQVKPEFEDQRAFITEHPLQAPGAVDGLIQHGILDPPVYPALKHLAVPVAEEDADPPFPRQLTPIAPGRRAGQLLVGLLVEGVDLNQPRVHPLIEQLDRFALAGAFHAIDQQQHREARLLLQLKLGLQQGLAQRRHSGLIGLLVDGMTDLCRLKHKQAPDQQMIAPA